MQSHFLLNQINPVFIDSVIPGQAPFTGNKSYTGARFTAMGTNYNTTTSRLESEYTAEQTGRLSSLLHYIQSSTK